jgi:hypothetical protein
MQSPKSRGPRKELTASEEEEEQKKIRLQIKKEAEEAAYKSLKAPLQKVLDIDEPKKRIQGTQVLVEANQLAKAQTLVNISAYERLNDTVTNTRTRGTFIRSLSNALRNIVLTKTAKYKQRKQNVEAELERQKRNSATLTREEREDDSNRFLIIANKLLVGRLDELLAKCEVITGIFFVDTNASRYEKQRYELTGERVSPTKAFEIFISSRFDEALAVLKNISQPKIQEALSMLLLALASGFQTYETKFINMALMGPPGVGKTTIAKQISQVLSRLLILLEGNCISITMGDLVAQFEGQTVAKTRSQLMAGLENVTLLDEAYALVNCGSGTQASREGYGQDAVNEMIDFMTKYQGLYCIIVAGYYKPMQCFFKSNEGFMRRFDGTFQFVIEQYNSDQLEPMLDKTLPDVLTQEEVDLVKSLVPQMVRHDALKNSSSDIQALSDDIKSAIGLQADLFMKKSESMKNAHLLRILYILKGIEYYLETRGRSIKVTTLPEGLHIEIK